MQLNYLIVSDEERKNTDQIRSQQILANFASHLSGSIVNSNPNSVGLNSNLQVINTTIEQIMNPNIGNEFNAKSASLISRKNMVILLGTALRYII